MTANALIARARHTARRLRAAGRRDPSCLAYQASRLSRRLARGRRHDERPILRGPNWDLTELASFLARYDALIEHECQGAARRYRGEK